MADELARVLEIAFKLNRAAALAWAEEIIAGNNERAVRELMRAYLRGTAAGYAYHGQVLGAPTSLPVAVARAWRDKANDFAVRAVNRAIRVFDERGDVDRVFVQSYATGLTRQTTLIGHDDTFKSLGAAFDVEFKRWVRFVARSVHRDWHDAIEDENAIPVDDLYTLPGGPNVGKQVYGPRDWDAVPDPGEHMNCGHALAFETRPTRENTVNPSGSVVYDPRNQPRTR